MLRYFQSCHLIPTSLKLEKRPPPHFNTRVQLNSKQKSIPCSPTRAAFRRWLHYTGEFARGLLACACSQNIKHGGRQAMAAIVPSRATDTAAFPFAAVFSNSLRAATVVVAESCASEHETSLLFLRCCCLCLHSSDLPRISIKLYVRCGRAVGAVRASI